MADLTPTEERLLEALPPYYGGIEDPDPTVLAWIRALAAECDRLRGLLTGLRDATIPARAAGPALARWERAFKLPVEPEQPDEVRNAVILAALRARNAVSGFDWKAAVETATGVTITVEENTPTANHLRIGVPWNGPTNYRVGRASELVVDRAPANQIVAIIYSGGFIVGESLVGDPI